MDRIILNGECNCQHFLAKHWCQHTMIRRGEWDIIVDDAAPGSPDEDEDRKRFAELRNKGGLS